MFTSYHDNTMHIDLWEDVYLAILHVFQRTIKARKRQVDR